MVYNDPPGESEEMMAEVGRHRCVLVTPDTRAVGQGTGDVVFDVEAWTGFYSSNTATWFALWLGCGPVVLCGMDCYQGELKYAHPWKHHPALDAPLDVIIRPWKEDGRHLEGVERVRVMSGPLVDVYGKYEAG
jgi:hypothetical protein